MICDRPRHRSWHAVTGNNGRPGITGHTGPRGRASQFIKTCRETAPFGSHGVTAAPGDALALVQTSVLPRNFLELGVSKPSTSPSWLGQKVERTCFIEGSVSSRSSGAQNRAHGETPTPERRKEPQALHSSVPMLSYLGLQEQGVTPDKELSPSTG